MLSVTSPARKNFWWLRVESNYQPRAYETLALSVCATQPFLIWKPAEELNLVPFRPTLMGSV